MAGSTLDKEVAAIQKVLNAIEPLDDAARGFVLRTVIDRLKVSSVTVSSTAGAGASTGGGAAQKQTAANVDVSDARKFLASKKPTQDIERVAVLAYILRHAQRVTEFKTDALSALNTTAGGRTISNMSQAAKNAMTKGYLAKAGAGKKQISPLGEAVVEALPDSVAVKAAIEEVGGRGKRKPTAKKKGARS
ncbi:MAG TPA: hypothetical protein VHC20_07185 [Candidatus Paceibacterota bacterium]|nr:hypothetical protein [Candidatus Paceibacterota bacterium]